VHVSQRAPLQLHLCGALLHGEVARLYMRASARISVRKPSGWSIFMHSFDRQGQGPTSLAGLSLHKTAAEFRGVPSLDQFHPLKKEVDQGLGQTKNVGRVIGRDPERRIHEQCTTLSLIALCCVAPHCVSPHDIRRCYSTIRRATWPQYPLSETSSTPLRSTIK